LGRPDPAALRGVRPGRGLPARRGGPGVRAVLPRRPGRRRAGAGSRARSAGRQADRGGARRPHLAGEPAQDAAGRPAPLFRSEGGLLDSGEEPSAQAGRRACAPFRPGGTRGRNLVIRLAAGGGRLAVVAMSGGVDSSVAAALVAEQRGVDAVLGISLRLYSTDEHAVWSGRSCCAPDDLYDARRAAAALGIRFYVYDAQERFRTEVIDDFVRAYAQGETPNPCVRCNQHVKFDWLLERARRLGADELVTGHYARIERGGDGRWLLLRARDAAKDQSYFLHGLTQEELALVRFPLGE